jgi:hypothetical protein
MKEVVVRKLGSRWGTVIGPVLTRGGTSLIGISIGCACALGGHVILTKEVILLPNWAAWGVEILSLFKGALDLINLVSQSTNVLSVQAE